MKRGMALPFLAGLLLGIAALGAVTLWHIHAPWVRASDPRAPGSPAAPGPPPEASDLLLVLSGTAIRAAAAEGRFDRLDLSWGWGNLLAQEVGPHRVLDLDRGLPETNPGAAAIVWSRSASARTDAAAAATLRRWAGAGATVLLELPPAALAALSGFAPDGGQPAAGGPLELPPESPLGDADAAALAQLDLPVPVAPGTVAPGTEVLLRAGGEPAAIARAEGSGRIVTLRFDLGRLLTSLQQGTPGDDLRVRNRYPERLAPRLESNDLVAAEALLDNEVPFADLLERLVAGWLEAARPLPAWWGYPGGAAGAFLMTHDDEGIGGRARWMIEHEQRIGAVSTTYFMPSGDRLGAEDAAAIAAAGGEIGLHWDRTASDAARSDRMLGPLRLLRVEPSLASQLGWLRERLPGRSAVRTSRVHFLEWDESWSGTLQALAAAGIAIDSTYGVDFGCRGYLFGTGRPFRPLDERGEPLPLLEVPHLGSEDLGGFDAAYLERLLAASRDGRHQAITVLFHPNAYQWTPSVALFRHWTGAYKAARDAGHVLTTMSGLAEFEAARARSPLASSWRDRRLEIRGRAGRDDLAIVLPLSAGGFTLREVRAGGAALPWRPAARMGRGAALVPVPAGEIAITADYGSGPS